MRVQKTLCVVLAAVLVSGTAVSAKTYQEMTNDERLNFPIGGQTDPDADGTYYVHESRQVWRKETTKADEPFKQPYDVAVVLNGEQVSFPDMQPYVDENYRTMVPIRFVAEDMGFDVQYEERGNRDKAMYEKLNALQNMKNEDWVLISRGNSRIEHCVGEDAANLTVNGTEYPVAFDTKSVLVQDRTMVPIRFIAELLNCDVQWEEETKTVNISSEQTAAAFPEPELTIHYPDGSGSDPKQNFTGKLFWFSIDNIAEYYADCDNYRFKIEFVTPAEFNTTEQYGGAALGWEVSDMFEWESVTPSNPEFAEVSSVYYTTRAAKANFVPYAGMPITYKLYVKRGCDGEVREYTYQDTLRLTYPPDTYVSNVQ